MMSLYTLVSNVSVMECSLFGDWNIVEFLWCGWGRGVSGAGCYCPVVTDSCSGKSVCKGNTQKSHCIASGNILTG